MPIMFDVQSVDRLVVEVSFSDRGSGWIERAGQAACGAPRTSTERRGSDCTHNIEHGVHRLGAKRQAVLKGILIWHASLESSFQSRRTGEKMYGQPNVAKSSSVCAARLYFANVLQMMQRRGPA